MTRRASSRFENQFQDMDSTICFGTLYRHEVAANTSNQCRKPRCRNRAVCEARSMAFKIRNQCLNLPICNHSWFREARVPDHQSQWNDGNCKPLPPQKDTDSRLWQIDLASASDGSRPGNIPRANIGLGFAHRLANFPPSAKPPRATNPDPEGTGSPSRPPLERMDRSRFSPHRRDGFPAPTAAVLDDFVLPPNLEFDGFSRSGRN